jgi:DNA-binding beta-propeller fold protein YncE
LRKTPVGELGVNAATNPDTVSVIDGASCNAVVRSGCGQTPPEVAVGSGPFGIAVNPTTDTIYVANTGQLFATANGDTVSVIDGATCNAAQSSGCTQVPPTVTVGRAPFGIAVDQATNSIYVVNNQGGEIDATLSTINGNHCDAAATSSCDAPPPTPLGSGRAPNGISLDPRTRTLYTADFLSATVSAISLAGSAAERLAPRFATGGAPEDVVFDPANGTVYVSSSLDGSVSVLPGTGVSRG